MTRRLQLAWPDDRPFRGRDGRPIRLLAASDVRDRALEFAENRAALGRIDGILGCGDLEPAWLGFLADAFHAPLVYVRGNHDRGGAWEEPEPGVPEPLASGRTTRLAGLLVAGFEWPGVREAGNARHPLRAWRDGLRLVAASAVRRVRRGRPEPLLVISHVPPRGAGEGPDRFHHGFDGYRWTLRRLRPPLWLHGHTTTATVPALDVTAGPTRVVNVTGSVVVEIAAASA